MKALAIVAALAATPAIAGPDRVSVLLGSNHIGAEGFNEVNPGLFATWEGDWIDLTAGVYHNSYSRTSVVATGYLSLIEAGDFDAGVFAGVAHLPGNGRLEMAHIGNDVVAIGGLQARYGNVFVQVIPMEAQYGKALVSFGLTFQP
jgi:hypothetical protein